MSKNNLELEYKDIATRAKKSYADWNIDEADETLLSEEVARIIIAEHTDDKPMWKPHIRGQVNLTTLGHARVQELEAEFDAGIAKVSKKKVCFTAWRLNSVVTEKAEAIYKKTIHNENALPTVQMVMDRLNIGYYSVCGSRVIQNNHDAEVYAYALIPHFSLGVLIMKSPRKFCAYKITSGYKSEAREINLKEAEDLMKEIKNNKQELFYDEAKVMVAKKHAIAEML